MVLFVGAAYLLTHFVVDRLQRRYLFISGVEYVLLGVLLGPAVVNTVAVFDHLDKLAPIILFCAGWIALLYGMEFRLRSLLDEHRGLSTRLALVDTLATGSVVGLAAYAFFVSGALMDPLPAAESACAAAMLACTAAAGSSSAVDLIAESYPDLPSRLLPTLRQTARLGDMLAIVGIGVLFCTFRNPVDGPIHVLPDPSPWILGTALLGLGLGALFSIFLGQQGDANSRFLAMVGITIFAAGASFFLEISDLTINMLLGAVLVNTADGPRVAETIEGSLKPITLVLLVFAGAMWVPVDPLAGLVVAVGYVAVRAIAKAGSLVLGSYGTSAPRYVFQGLMAQGDVAVAIAVSFRLIYDGQAADLAYTAVLVSVMLHQFVAPRMVKRLLIDAGELDHDAPLHRPAAA